MKISELSKKVQCNIETIRYYEKIELLLKPERNTSNYRIYNDYHIKQLKFIVNARSLGFSLCQIKELLMLTINDLNSCEKFQSISQKHLQVINQKINDLNILKKKIKQLLNCCTNNAEPTCPFINDFF